MQSNKTYTSRHDVSFCIYVCQNQENKERKSKFWVSVCVCVCVCVSDFKNFVPIWKSHIASNATHSKNKSVNRRSEEKLC